MYGALHKGIMPNVNAKKNSLKKGETARKNRQPYKIYGYLAPGSDGS